MDRYRNFAFIVYPDDERLPHNWQDELAALHVPMAISPLHDSDVYGPDDEGHTPGEPKKPHYHVLMTFSGKKSPCQVLTMLEPLNVIHVENVNDVRGYCRYLCHLDDPAKAQYKVSDIVSLCGFDLGVITALTASQRAIVRDQIIDFITEYNITEYSDMVIYARSCDNPGWADYCEGHTVFLNAFIKSFKYKRFSPAPVVDEEDKEEGPYPDLDEL